MEKNVKNTVIFIDSGDTIIDESTEVRDYNHRLYEGGIVVYAEPLPGICEALSELYSGGYKLILVADGYFVSFKNMFSRLGIYRYFDAFVTSEAVGVQKPDIKMFNTAMGAAGLTAADKNRVVMIGNNLARDIRGANEAGVTSVFLDWTPRYPKEPSSEIERPDYTLHHPSELVSFIDGFERGISKAAG